ncbi:hypothetical protein [Emticicia sp. BO119]|uniref:hypothetical protein n=1 Tax=Emticicia sp. BO119 TaxID=2757768 RepID=UPI0015F08D77|nr:hypothetical protein [Emticicia sp. BO119]MBA4850482.1 hypothetical protein [Emticicia sp. BO119]
MNKIETKEVRLAIEIAEKLNDLKSLAQFIGMCQKYKESFLKDILKKVVETPQHKIRKTRGALFTYLVRLHADKDNYRS